MQVFRPDELDSDILGDLLEEINELYEISEQTLLEMELLPEDNELQRALFRALHTIKGDLGLVNFTPLIPLLQHLEDLLDYLRKGQMRYCSAMSDLVLLIMDNVKSFVKDCVAHGKVSYNGQLYDDLIRYIAQVNPENQSEHPRLMVKAALLLNPDLDVEIHALQPSPGAVQTAAAPAAQVDRRARRKEDRLPFDVSAASQGDIVFFRQLMVPVEKRTRYLEGRGDRMAKLALLLNKMAGSPLDEEQLLVACYVHDFGMAFMPLEVLHKPDNLSVQEFNLMRSHVYKSARLLEHLERWNEARKMVMQHHERLDGSGYPLGLKGDEICDGARLIAILDTFEAMTHTRANQAHVQHAKKNAVVEINRVAQGQYCPNWMQVFNRMMAGLLNT